MARTRAAAERRTPAPLVAQLRAQQAALAPSPARAANLAALAEGGTAVVVTGQQVGLFLGPLYGFYKAASAVATARALAVEAGVRCVPLFWLQTEDHDFAEIASATVAGPGGKPVTLSLPTEPAAEARVSIAHRRLPAEVAPLLEALGDLLGPGPAAQETLALLRAHYVAGRPLAAGLRRSPGRALRRRGALDPRSAHAARGRAGSPDLPASAGRLGRDRTPARRAARRAGGGRLRRADPDAPRLCAGLRPPRRRHGSALPPRTTARRRRRVAAGRMRGDLHDARDRRRARARSAPLLDLGAAAADRAGRAVADGGLRRRPGRGQLLRAARRRSTTRSACRCRSSSRARAFAASTRRRAGGSASSGSTPTTLARPRAELLARLPAARRPDADHRRARRPRRRRDRRPPSTSSPPSRPRSIRATAT